MSSASEVIKMRVSKLRFENTVLTSNKFLVGPERDEILCSCKTLGWHLHLAAFRLSARQEGDDLGAHHPVEHRLHRRLPPARRLEQRRQQLRLLPLLQLELPLLPQRMRARFHGSVRHVPAVDWPDAAAAAGAAPLELHGRDSSASRVGRENDGHSREI